MKLKNAEGWAVLEGSLEDWYVATSPGHDKADAMFEYDRRYGEGEFNADKERGRARLARVRVEVIEEEDA